MKTFKIASLATGAAAILAAALFFTTSTAQDFVTKVGEVDMVSINRMALADKGDSYSLAVGITFQNQNNESIKMRNGSFLVQVEWKKPNGVTERMEIGQTEINELDIPGGGSKRNPGTVSTTVHVALGAKNPATNEKLLRLFNVVGDPGARMTMILQGTSELGLELPKGWLFEKGKVYEAQLKFVPSVQRKVLFN